MRTRAGIAVLALACALVPAACGRSGPNVDCPTTDMPRTRDVASATRAVEVAAAKIGMADVPTSVDNRSLQSKARDFTLDSGGQEWELSRISRSELVDFVDVRPAVEALEDEGFDHEEHSEIGETTYTLERGSQRARVTLGPRLRGYGGKVEARVEVDTGCRPA